MAEPQERRAHEEARVAACTVTECTYNEHEECHAGEIRVEMRDGGAACGTYTPRKPKARP